MDNAVRNTNAKDQIWYSTDGDVVKIGFTASFLTKMEECWHVLPASISEVSEKAPLMAVETNDSLLSIRSPVTGRITEFNPKALNFPDKLVSSDIIFKVNTNRQAVIAAPIAFAPQTDEEREDNPDELWEPRRTVGFGLAPQFMPQGALFGGGMAVPAAPVGRPLDHWRVELEGLRNAQEAERRNAEIQAEARMLRDARLPRAGVAAVNPVGARAPNPPGNPRLNGAVAPARPRPPVVPRGRF